jgi:undecaprenyl-diphosphatase
VELKTHWHWFTGPIRVPAIGRLGRNFPGVGRLGGDFMTFPLVAAICIVARDRRRCMAAAFVALSGLLTGANSLVKWIVGRARPYQGEVYGPHPFVGGWHGLFGPNQSFPSGDVCLAAATATSLTILLPRWRWLWAAIVLIVAMERIGENAHYPSDTVAGAVLGWALAQLAWRLTGRPRILPSVA